MAPTAAAATTTSSDDDDNEVLKDELASLRIVRATLESLKQLVTAIHEDVETATKNYKDITGLNKRWDLAIEQSQDGAKADRSTQGTVE